MNKKLLKDYFFILLGSVLYAVSTVLFIFPHSLLLGGTSGISVILNHFIPWCSPGTVLVVINLSLLVIAFFTLGREMATKTVVGTVLTTLSVSLFEPLLTFQSPLIANQYLSAVVGALVIAVSSGMLFYVGSSSGGTDVLALIIKKYSNIRIGKALLIVDFLIVVVGGLVSGLTLAIASLIGLLIKTFGIDFVIANIQKYKNKHAQNEQ